MKTVIVRRKEMGEFGTFGFLEIEGVTGPNDFHTGELPWKDNAQGLSCIPAGEYVLHWQKSPKFGWCFEVMDVPDRSRVLFHAGNWCGDVELGHKSDVEGCTILGLKRGTPEGQPGVVMSQKAVQRFHELMGTEDARLIVIDEWLEAGDPGAGNGQSGVA